MNTGPAAKAIGHTIDLTFEAIQRTAPHVIAANKVVVNKVIIPIGTHALVGVTAIIAKVVSPRRKA